MTEEIFKTILLKHKWPTKTTEPRTTIGEIEKLISFNLPDDYIEFLQSFSGYEGLVGPEFIRLWDIDQIIESNKNSGILEAFSDTIGIGDNGSSEIIAIEKTSLNGLRIILTPAIFEKDAHLTIGVSFTDFLTRLDKGKLWFKNS